MLDDRMDGLERSFVDLAKELRAAGALPGSPADAAAASAAAGSGGSTAATPGGGVTAVSSGDSSGSGVGMPSSSAQTATVAAPSGAVASAGPMGAVAAVGGAVAQVMTGGSSPQPAGVVPGGKDSSRGQLYSINKIQSSISEVINSGGCRPAGWRGQARAQCLLTVQRLSTEPGAAEW